MADILEHASYVSNERQKALVTAQSEKYNTPAARERQIHQLTHQVRMIVSEINAVQD